MIENARLTDRVVEQETLRRDIALASDVQRRLLPDAPPRAELRDFAAISVPARRIGGDYYDFVELRDRRIGIALADVSGKGVAAALIMSVVQASLRIISSEGDVPPPRLVARMNEFVYRSTPASSYATFFYAQLDEQRRQLRYVNAGHNAPYLLRAGRPSTADSAPPEIEQLSVGGTVVGMFPEMELRRGDRRVVPRRCPPRLHRRRPRGAQPRGRRVRRGTPAAAAPPDRSPPGQRDQRAAFRRDERLDPRRGAVRRSHLHRDEGAPPPPPLPWSAAGRGPRRGRPRPPPGPGGALCARAYANPTSFASSHARPRSWMAVGCPCVSTPAGITIVGLPVAALGVSRRLNAALPRAAVVKAHVAQQSRIHDRVDAKIVRARLVHPRSRPAGRVTCR